MVMCRFEDTGQFTVPASTFNLIPKHFDHAIMVVSRVAETVQTVGDFSVSVEVASAVMSGPFSLEPSAPEPFTPARSHTFVSVSLGNGGTSRVEADRPTPTMNARLQSGARVAHGIYLLTEGSFLFRDNISETVTTSEEDVFGGIGIRWAPFEPHLIRWGSGGIDAHGFYATALVGFDVRERTTQITPTASSEETSYFPATSLSVGWFGYQGRDWSYGPELREQLTDYNGHAQWGWAMLFAIHLNQ